MNMEPGQDPKRYAGHEASETSPRSDSASSTILTDLQFMGTYTTYHREFRCHAQVRVPLNSRLSSILIEAANGKTEYLSSLSSIQA